MGKHIFVTFQYIIPQHFISKLIGKLANSKNPRLKNFLFVSYSSIRSIPKEFEKISLLLKEISEENEATLYFVYLPEYYRFTDIKNFHLL